MRRNGNCALQKNRPEIVLGHFIYQGLRLLNTIEDLIWRCDWINRYSESRENHVVFEHTPSKDSRVYVTNTEDICIDAGCVFGGNLCALIIEEDGISQCIYEPKSDNDILP